MKKKVIKIFIIISIIALVTLLLFIGYKIYCNKRYKEIKAAFEKAAVWEINATHPNGCLPTEYDSAESLIPAYWYLQQGYLKKKDILDVNHKTYCNGYAKVKCDKQNRKHKVYIKCKNYEDEGYEDTWLVNDRFTRVLNQVK